MKNASAMISHIAPAVHFYVSFTQALISYGGRTIRHPNPFLIMSVMIYFITSLNGPGQEPGIPEEIADIAEELAGDETGENEAMHYTEKLHELLDDRVKINSAAEQEISRLFFLSGFQIKSLADYISKNGTIVSAYEIANIPGFDRRTAEIMIPFITLHPERSASGLSLKWKNTILSSLSLKPSQNETSYPGSPWKIITRYRFSCGYLSGGFTAEKDSGEKYFSCYPPGAEYLSAYLAYTGNGVLNKLIAGDYSARFGLGTGINTTVRTGISLTSPVSPPGSDEIRPYTSTDENNFLRGLAASFRLKKTNLSIFFSSNSIDASAGTADGLINGYIQSFDLSGLHNTRSSLMKKDAVVETIIGSNLSATFRNCRAGILFSENRFSLPVKKSDPQLREYFDFEGSVNRLATVYYSALVKKMIIFGEISYDLNDKTALVQGVSARPADRLNISIFYRNYQPGFTSFHGKGPYSNSSGENIKGLAGNFTFEAAKYLFISAGCDVRHNHWLKYRCSSPSLSVNRELRIKYLPSEKFTLEGLYGYRKSELDNRETRGVVKQQEIVSRSWKVTTRISPSAGFRFGNRIEYRKISPSGNRGMMMFQDLCISPKTMPITIWFRFCIFNTDGWDSRIYTYENDLLYSFSIPALSGSGNRSYIMCKWILNEYAEMRIKYGITSIASADRQNICNNEIKMQFKIVF